MAAREHTLNTPNDTLRNIDISGHILQPNDWQEQRVVTFAQIAEVHDVSVKNLQSSFRENNEHFQDGEDTYLLDFEQATKLLGSQGVSRNGLRVFTESGYLLLTKPMRDKMSWRVQKLMIQAYFRDQRVQKHRPLTTSEMFYAQAKFNLEQERRLAVIETEVSDMRSEVRDVHSAVSDVKDELRSVHGQVDDVSAKVEDLDVKADAALEASKRMRIESFIVGNKLLHQFPGKIVRGVRTWPEERRRLMWYCKHNHLRIVPIPVEDKEWESENTYPLQAFEWLLRFPYEQDRQIFFRRHR